MEGHDVEALLGTDLAALVATLPSPLLAATQVTGLRATALTRATFRLRLADRSVLKGRRMDSADDALRADTLGRLLDERSFSRPFARRGAALLEPWVDGQRLDRADAGVDTLRECGRLLGAIHSITVDTAGERRRWLPDSRLADIEQRLRHLRELGLLPRTVEKQLASIARDSKPAEVAVGVIHRDLWPRNVVVDRVRRPHVVDNASIAIGAHAFDLARTAYLWPMDERSDRAFRDGYEETAPGPARQSVFSMIDVLSEVALFRRLAGARGVRRPVTRLRTLAAGA